MGISAGRCANDELTAARAARRIEERILLAVEKTW
jgi:hypothetical protein